MKLKALISAMAVGLLATGVAHAELVKYNLGPDGKNVAIRGFHGAHLSHNGRFVTFDAGMDHASPRMIQWDRQTGERKVVLNEYSNVSMSQDARFLALHTKTPFTENDDASNWQPTDVYVKDLATNTFELITEGLDIPISASTIAPGGNAVAYVTSNKLVIVNRASGERQELALGGSLFNPLLSADGKYLVVNVTLSQNSSQLILVDVESGKQTVVFENLSLSTSFSADGRFLAFAGNFVTGDRAMRLYDRKSGQLTTLTKGNGQPINIRDMNGISISGDGRYLAFNSIDDDIVPNDHNGVADTFVFDRVNHEFARVSIRDDGQDFSRDSVAVSISADGHYVTFAALGSGNNYDGYLTTNPLYGAEYCKGYSEFNAD